MYPASNTLCSPAGCLSLLRASIQVCSPHSLFQYLFLCRCLVTRSLFSFSSPYSVSPLFYDPQENLPSGTCKNSDCELHWAGSSLVDFFSCPASLARHWHTRGPSLSKVGTTPDILPFLSGSSFKQMSWLKGAQDTGLGCLVHRVSLACTTKNKRFRNE